jgi:SAM-dependent methyltransferase
VYCFQISGTTWNFADEYLSKIWQGKSHGAPVRVLDMCCGKGGDLLKWRRGNITHLVCADIAEVSVEQCQARYNDLQNRSRNDRGFAPVFTAEFISADCTKVSICFIMWPAIVQIWKFRISSTLLTVVMAAVDDASSHIIDINHGYHQGWRG